MSFNYKFLQEYQNLIQNTNLQKGYQEFIRLFQLASDQSANPIFFFSLSGEYRRKQYGIFLLSVFR